MAFGIKKAELELWKKKVTNGEIAILTHYWQDQRFPEETTVTKVGCSSILRLMAWGNQYGLKEEWIHYSNYPHFDLFGEKQKEVLLSENRHDDIIRFNL